MPVAKMPRYKEFLALLRKRLPEKKVSHSVFVAEYLSSFAPKLGLDHNAAVTAGLLHDLCRALDDAEMLKKAREYHLNIGDLQLERPVLLHGPVAAEELRNEHMVENEDVYEAVYWHTTGRPGLGRLGQALYLADFAEPTRAYPEAAQVRDLLRKQSFEAAMLFAAQAKLEYVKQKNVENPDGYAFCLWLRREYT